MRFNKFSAWRAFTLMAVTLLAGVSVMAEKPEWAGQGGSGKKSESKEYKHQDKREREEVRPGGYFQDKHRAVIRDYYGREYGVGKRCPPGLAKKNNGCMPPGQARKWAVGRVLPRDVIYYSVAPAVVVQLGTPPAGHKFVRVAGDILLIAIGTGMVIDAIEDLGRQ